MWQDLFAATRAAQSTDYLERLACSRAAPAPKAHHPACPFDDPSLGISRDTVFTQFLCPEALVQQHRLGALHVRRLYQALQVRGLGWGGCKGTCMLVGQGRVRADGENRHACLWAARANPLSGVHACLLVEWRDSCMSSRTVCRWHPAAAQLAYCTARLPSCWNARLPGAAMVACARVPRFAVQVLSLVPWELTVGIWPATV